MTDHRSVTVSEIPDCDYCSTLKVKRPAFADAKIGNGGWANVCDLHFQMFHCNLGMGWGQRLVLEEPQPQPTFEEQLTEGLGNVADMLRRRQR